MQKQQLNSFDKWFIGLAVAIVIMGAAALYQHSRLFGMQSLLDSLGGFLLIGFVIAMFIGTLYYLGAFFNEQEESLSDFLERINKPHAGE